MGKLIQEHYKEKVITCPYCDYRHVELCDYDSDLWEEGEHETECASCKKHFTVETEVDYRFTTRHEEPDIAIDGQVGNNENINIVMKALGEIK